MNLKPVSVWILLCVYPLLSPASGENAALTDQKFIPAESGRNVTLPCRAPNSNISIIVTEWSRADLEKEYVLLYRDEQFDPDYQHPSFKDRVDLQDRQMKDGDVSVILKNVTVNDTGTYECRVFQRGKNRGKRAHLMTAPISIIYLRVVDPPGQPGGLTEDGGKKDGGEKDGGEKHGGKEVGDVRLRVGISVSAVLLLLLVAAVVVVLIFREHKQQQQQQQQGSSVELQPV